MTKKAPAKNAAPPKRQSAIKRKREDEEEEENEEEEREDEEEEEEREKPFSEERITKKRKVGKSASVPTATTKVKGKGKTADKGKKKGNSEPGSLTRTTEEYENADPNKRRTFKICDACSESGIEPAYYSIAIHANHNYEVHGDRSFLMKKEENRQARAERKAKKEKEKGLTKTKSVGKKAPSVSDAKGSAKKKSSTSLAPSRARNSSNKVTATPRDTFEKEQKKSLSPNRKRSEDAEYENVTALHRISDEVEQLIDDLKEIKISFVEDKGFPSDAEMVNEWKSLLHIMIDTQNSKKKGLSSIYSEDSDNLDKRSFGIELKEWARFSFDRSEALSKNVSAAKAVNVAAMKFAEFERTQKKKMLTRLRVVVYTKLFSDKMAALVHEAWTRESDVVDGNRIFINESFADDMDPTLFLEQVGFFDALNSTLPPSDRRSNGVSDKRGPPSAVPPPTTSPSSSSSTTTTTTIVKLNRFFGDKKDDTREEEKREINERETAESALKDIFGSDDEEEREGEEANKLNSSNSDEKIEENESENDVNAESTPMERFPVAKKTLGKIPASRGHVEKGEGTDFRNFRNEEEEPERSPAKDGKNDKSNADEHRFKNDSNRENTKVATNDINSSMRESSLREEEAGVISRQPPPTQQRAYKRPVVSLSRNAAGLFDCSSCNTKTPIAQGINCLTKNCNRLQCKRCNEKMKARGTNNFYCRNCVHEATNAK